MAGGAAGGFTGGFAGTLLNKGSLGDAIFNGVKGACIGAATGLATAGVLGAVSYGLNNLYLNTWHGAGTVTDVSWSITTKAMFEGAGSRTLASLLPSFGSALGEGGGIGLLSGLSGGGVGSAIGINAAASGGGTFIQGGQVPGGASPGSTGNVYFTGNPTLTMGKQLPNTCVTSIMEYANHAFGGTTNQGVYDLYYMQNYDAQYYVNGVDSRNINPFVNHFFKTSGFTSFNDAVNSGYPVMTDMFVSQQGNMINTHNVLVIGYNSGSGNLIYMDPASGGASTGALSLFKTSYAIPLTGNR